MLNYYKNPDGKASSETLNIRYSIRHLMELYSTVGLESFGPLMLLKVRDQMIEEDIVRGTINQRIARIKRIFKWAVTSNNRGIWELNEF